MPRMRIAGFPFPLRDGNRTFVDRENDGQKERVSCLSTDDSEYASTKYWDRIACASLPKAHLGPAWMTATRKRGFSVSLQFSSVFVTRQRAGGGRIRGQRSNKHEYNIKTNARHKACREEDSRPRTPPRDATHRLATTSAAVPPPTTTKSNVPRSRATGCCPTWMLVSIISAMEYSGRFARCA